VKTEPPIIATIDNGICNLRSVTKALEAAGAARGALARRDRALPIPGAPPRHQNVPEAKLRFAAGLETCATTPALQYQ
jgi:hypothetical protein